MELDNYSINESEDYSFIDDESDFYDYEDSEADYYDEADDYYDEADESDDYYDESFAADADNEDYYDESRRYRRRYGRRYGRSRRPMRSGNARRLALARARARRRRLALARARRLPLVGPGSIPSRRPVVRQPVSQMPPKPATVPSVKAGFKNVSSDIKRTKSTLKKVDLENKVQGDVLGSALGTQKRRIDSTQDAMALSKVLDEVQKAMPDDSPVSAIAKAAVPLGSLLLLKPSKRGSGLRGLVTDPRVWGILVAGGAAAFSQYRKSDRKQVKAINFQLPSGEIEHSKSPELAMTVNAVGKDGSITTTGRNIQYYSPTPSKVKFDGSKATFDASAIGETITIFARDLETGLIDQSFIEVKM